MVFACFVFNAILCNCGFLRYEFYMRLSRMINNDGFYHSDHSRHCKNEMGRKFHSTGTLGTRHTQMFFAFFVLRSIRSPLDFR